MTNVNGETNETMGHLFSLRLFIFMTKVTFLSLCQLVAFHIFLFKIVMFVCL